MKSYEQQLIKIRLNDLIMSVYISKIVPPKKYNKIIKELHEMFKEFIDPPLTISDIYNKK